jgi:hypothetical protein
VPNSGSPHHDYAHVCGRSPRVTGRTDRVAVLHAAMIRSRQKTPGEKTHPQLTALRSTALCEGMLPLPGRFEADFFGTATSSAALGGRGDTLNASIARVFLTLGV